MDHVFRCDDPNSEEEQRISDTFAAVFDESWQNYLVPDFDKHYLLPDFDEHYLLPDIDKNDLLPDFDENYGLADLFDQWKPNPQSDTGSQLPSGVNLYHTTETDAPGMYEEELNRQAEDFRYDVSLSRPEIMQPPNAVLITTEQPTSLLTVHRPLSSSTSSFSWQTDSLVSSRIPSAETDGSWVNIQPKPSSVRINTPDEQHSSSIRAGTGPSFGAESSAQSTWFLAPQSGYSTIYPDYLAGAQSTLESTSHSEKPRAIRSRVARGPMSSDVTLPPPRKRGAFTQEGRNRVNKTRKLGACIRCKLMKAPVGITIAKGSPRTFLLQGTNIAPQCEEGTPCGTCLRLYHSARAVIAPCYRADLDEIVPFRQGNSRYGMTKSKLLPYRWSSHDTTERVVDLVYPFELHEPTAVSKLSINCRRFVVHQEIVMDPLTTTQGQTVVVENPPFAWVRQYLTDLRIGVNVNLVRC